MTEEQVSPSCKLSRNDWVRIFSEWKQSGETQPVFCKRNKINYSTFVCWRVKLKKEQANKQGRARSHKSTFVPIKVKATNCEEIKLLLPEGIQLSIPVNADKLRVRSLFAMLGVL